MTLDTTSAPEGPTVTARDLRDELDAGHALFILDVRTPEEYRDWHIPDSTNLPLQALEAGERPDVPPQARLVTLCLHGARSRKARDILTREGRTARSLEGGMVAWNSIFDVATVPASNAEVRQMRRIGKGCIGYVVASAGEALVIDPTLDVDAHMEEAEKLGARVKVVLDTHAHADHASGGRRLAEACGAKYLAPEEVGLRVAGGIVRDGDGIRVGNVTLRALATPGHTPGSLTYRLDDLAFVGDTLFIESVGRPDLGQDLRPNAQTLWDTLHGRFLALPASTRILPGHYGETITLRSKQPLVATLDALRRTLPALAMPQPAFVDWVAHNALPKPENFETIKRHNLGQIDVDVDELRDLEAGPNRCAVG